MADRGGLKFVGFIFATVTLAVMLTGIRVPMMFEWNAAATDLNDPAKSPLTAGKQLLHTVKTKTIDRVARDRNQTEATASYQIQRSI